MDRSAGGMNPAPTGKFGMFGGSLPSIRRNDSANCAAAATSLTSAALAVIAEPAAMQKCQFGGLLPHSRLLFRRELCKICTNCESCESKSLSAYLCVSAVKRLSESPLPSKVNLC